MLLDIFIITFYGKMNWECIFSLNWNRHCVKIIHSNIYVN